MKERILLVEGADDARATLKSLLETCYDVHEAPDAERALALARSAGPFAVVVADQHGSGRDGIELLRALRSEHPDCVGVLLAESVSPEQLVAAVQQGHVYRTLARPACEERLLCAVAESLEQQQRGGTARVGEDELIFVREALTSLNCVLEERVAEQTAALERQHRFAVALNGAESMGEILGLAAHAVSDALSGRGVHVQVWDDRNVTVEAFCGPEMSRHLHEEPLLSRRGILGEIVVDVGGFPGERLPEHSARELSAIASSTAVAVRTELRRRQRDHAQQATILALARLSEQRDHETGRHLERVAAYCTLIAEGLREDGCHPDTIDARFVEDLARSSPLHDIGKVGVPDAILLKPARLTPGEWEIMKTHAETGAQTLESVMREFEDQGFLVMGRDIARSHHEKWDGTGYPHGLAGAAIPLAARIVALADVYDALTSRRPYKAAWTHHEALRWILEQSGKHFDPDVVASFARRADQADAVRARLADVLPAPLPAEVDEFSAR